LRMSGKGTGEKKQQTPLEPAAVKLLEDIRPAKLGAGAGTKVGPTVINVVARDWITGIEGHGGIDQGRQRLRCKNSVRKGSKMA